MRKIILISFLVVFCGHNAFAQSVEQVDETGKPCVCDFNMSVSNNDAQKDRINRGRLRNVKIGESIFMLPHYKMECGRYISGGGWKAKEDARCIKGLALPADATGWKLDSARKCFIPDCNNNFKLSADGKDCTYAPQDLLIDCVKKRDSACAMAALDRGEARSSLYGAGRINPLYVAISEGWTPKNVITRMVNDGLGRVAWNNVYPIDIAMEKRKLELFELLAQPKNSPWGVGGEVLITHVYHYMHNEAERAPYLAVVKKYYPNAKQMKLNLPQPKNPGTRTEQPKPVVKPDPVVKPVVEQKPSPTPAPKQKTAPAVETVPDMSVSQGIDILELPPVNAQPLPVAPPQPPKTDSGLEIEIEHTVDIEITTKKQQPDNGGLRYTTSTSGASTGGMRYSTVSRPEAPVSDAMPAIDIAAIPTGTYAAAVIVSETPQMLKMREVEYTAAALRNLTGKYADAKRSVWKTADGNFNGARLASDSIAGVALGTVGGIVANKIITNNQVESGFDSIYCSVAGTQIGGFDDMVSLTGSADKDECYENNMRGNSFVWAAKNVIGDDYFNMLEDIDNPDNNTCWARVDLVSANMDLSGIKPKYFMPGQSFTCGSWSDRATVRKKILDAKKSGRTWGTVAGAVGGAAVGVGAMELFGNKLIGGKVEGQKNKNLTAERVLMSHMTDQERADYKKYQSDLERLCSELSAMGATSPDCK